MPLYDFTKDKYDIIIQAGQSNADGTAFGSTESPRQPRMDVLQMEANLTGEGFFIIPAAERLNCGNLVAHFALTFADEYIRAGKLEDGRKLLILRTAVGGTGFSDNRWKMTDDLYLRMMDMIRTALALNPENRLVALLWHQGETDAINHMDHDTYLGHIGTLTASVRNTFGVPALPFAAGDFVQDWKAKNAQISAPIIAALRDFCEGENCAFVETDGLLSNAQDEGNPNFGFDDIHFCRRAIYELGRRYYAAYERIVG